MFCAVTATATAPLCHLNLHLHLRHPKAQVHPHLILILIHLHRHRHLLTPPRAGFHPLLHRLCHPHLLQHLSLSQIIPAVRRSFLISCFESHSSILPSDPVTLNPLLSHHSRLSCRNFLATSLPPYTSTTHTSSDKRKGFAILAPYASIRLTIGIILSSPPLDHEGSPRDSHYCQPSLITPCCKPRFPSLVDTTRRTLQPLSTVRDPFTSSRNHHTPSGFCRRCDLATNRLR